MNRKCLFMFLAGLIVLAPVLVMATPIQTGLPGESAAQTFLNSFRSFWLPLIGFATIVGTILMLAWSRGRGAGVALIVLICLALVVATPSFLMPLIGFASGAELHEVVRPDVP